MYEISGGLAADRAFVQQAFTPYAVYTRSD